jgi:hypothetical protein
MPCNATVNICIYFLVFVSLMMSRYESKDVGDNLMSNNRVYVTQLSVFRWSLINSDKVHWHCKVLDRNTHFMVEVEAHANAFNSLKLGCFYMYHLF